MNRLEGFFICIVLGENIPVGYRWLQGVLRRHLCFSRLVISGNTPDLVQIEDYTTLT